MFQPQPTPFAYSSYGITIANAEIPEYAFQPTPLGHIGTGHVGGAGVVAGGPTADLFTSPVFHHRHHHHHSSILPASNPRNPSHHLSYNSAIPHNNHQQHHNHHNHNQTHRTVKMEPQHPNDIAQQEAAARDYKPQLEGPLVGEKRPSTAITEEYAKADPIYVTKTMALPQTYSHYRPIQGDGNCGWRAIVFGYFETLVRCGDLAHVQGELARLTSLNTLIENVGGHNAWLFEDMVSETFDLFSAIIAAMMNDGDAMPLVTDRFNNLESSQNIVYHQRLLASSWLKGNYAQYEPWIEGGVENYVQNIIMPIDREIDHIGVVLLHGVLLKPANVVLEIAYLDRSDGSKVNTHRMPEEANDQDPTTLGPIIYLLYRPGHYDILYRDSLIQPAPIPPPPTSLQIHRATSLTHPPEIEHTIPSLQDFSTVDMSALAMIPGYAPPDMSPLASPPAAPSPMTDIYVPSPQSPWMPQPFSDTLTGPAPAPQPSPPQQQPPTPMTVHPLRFSKYNFPDLVESSTFPEPSFTTNTFKNSHFNVAHYNNMNFQPEMYRPEAEEEVPHAKNSSGGRKRSSGEQHCAVIKKENRG
ncbi:cysteine proteinase [Durotheca rogersii]|uniref:cysteine proteinase n=1 Tax=Durotheca rogersii TaxID=419775 RepID=UPI00221FA0DD|nr:cysteine proteinase [Durotheca rogersii]KAI5867498.1 cysteine proteinase [Durotheca rogersii]